MGGGGTVVVGNPMTSGSGVSAFGFVLSGSQGSRRLILTWLVLLSGFVSLQTDRLDRLLRINVERVSVLRYTKQFHKYSE